MVALFHHPVVIDFRPIPILDRYLMQYDLFLENYFFSEPELLNQSVTSHLVMSDTH